MKKKNIKITKKGLVAILMALGISFTATGCGNSSSTASEVEQNVTGYTDISPYQNNFFLDLIDFTKHVDENEFVVLHAGNHAKTEEIDLYSKIKYCNNNNISVGIVISPNEYTEDFIYDDVEYAKSLVRDYSLDLPIFFDIDDIIENDSLNVEQKTKLINDFLTKCTSNGIKVELYGTDTNLTRMKKYCKITGYSAYVVKDSGEEGFKYDGEFNFYEDIEGTIHATENISKEIVNKGLNNPDRFVSDGARIYTSSEDILDIAMTYGLSVDELMDFNDTTESDLKEGDVLRIPNTIGTISPAPSSEFVSSDDYVYKLADISSNNTITDWNKVKESYDGLILRALRYGGQEDSQFENYYKEAQENGVRITGIYTYNTPGTDTASDLDEFKKQVEEMADLTIDKLQNKTIPVAFLDVESNGVITVNEQLPSEYVDVLIDTWNKKITDAGYIAGIYANESNMEYLQSCLDYSLSDKVIVWVAGGAQYETESEDAPKYDINDISSYNPYSYYGKEFLYDITVEQVTNRCINSGVGNADGCVDLDYSKIDFVRLSVDGEYYEFDIKEFEKFDIGLIGLWATNIAIVGLALAGTILTIKLVTKKKKATATEEPKKKVKK